MGAAALPRRGVNTALVLTGVGSEHGLTPQACLAGTGMTPELLTDPMREIEAEQELGVIRNLLEALPHVPHLGLIAGRRYHFTTFGVWGLGLASSATLGDAVDYARRTLPGSFALCHWDFGLEGGLLRWRLTAEHLPAWARRFALERDAASIRTVQHQILGESIPFEALRTSFPQPENAAPYEEVFGPSLEFDSAHDEVLIAPEHCDRPLPQADPHTHRWCAQEAQRITARRSEAAVVTAVRRHIAHDLASVDLETVARAVALSPRTLRRRLNEHGASFRDLLEEARRSRALELLARRTPVADIAARLGYADSAAFNHAFKRWTGLSPRDMVRRG